jgi:hypothetical protein
MKCFICGRNLDKDPEVIPIRKMEETNNRIFLCADMECWTIWCEMRNMYNDM